MSLPLHSQAPDFTLPSTSGSDFTLSQDLEGKGCILYFYPKDFTPGCNAEACEFRDHFEEFKEFNLPVIGISTDSLDVHYRFKEKYQLPFELLSDTDGEVSKQYDAIIPFVKLAKRVTYLLDKEHKIIAAYKNQFGAKKHIKKMLNEIVEQ